MLLGAAFLPGPFGVLAWFGFVPLFAALERRVRTGQGPGAWFRLGYVFGLVFFLIGTHWIALLADVAMTTPWLKYPAWVLAAAYLALFAGLATWLSGWLARRARAPLALVLPFAFLVVEEFRAAGEMGFPWFQPGYTQHAYAPIVQLASVGGITLVTLWVLGLNVLIWQAWRGGGRARALAGAVLAVLLPWFWGQRVLDAAPRTLGPAVALVQGNVPGEMKWSGHHTKEILDRFLALTRAAAADSTRPSIVIWPETATGTYLRLQVDQALQVVALAGAARVQVFSGFPDYELEPGGGVRYYNAAGMFEPDGATGRIYAKRHLVPFGERMPFQSVVPALGKLQFGQAEWTPGRARVLFDAAPGPFGTLICFESIFPDLARDDVRHGARWLVNITNDEWFGNSSALYQHAAMAVFRAAENHVPLARCANTGLTELIDANGRVTRRLPVWRPGVLVGRLGVPGIPTLYTRFGDWPGVLAVVVTALIALAGFRRRPPRPAR